MKTIKAKIMNKVDFTKELRSFNSLVRIAFNRFQDGMNEKQVRTCCKKLFSGQNSWFIQCAVKEGQTLYSKFKNKKIVFGGKINYKKYLRGLICKQQLKKKRQMPIFIQGQKLKKGNRCFDFELNNNKIYYKPHKGQKLEIQINKFSGKFQKELCVLQNLIDKREVTVSVKFNNQNVWIAYDESLMKEKVYDNLKSKRVLGIDLNPNAIGLSVLQFNCKNKFKVLYKQVFNMFHLNDKKFLLTKDKEYQNRKRKYELIKVCYKIDVLMNIWKCSNMVIEDLVIRSSDKGKGKEFNRLCNNVWCRHLIKNKLNMLANIHGYKLIEVNPAYSSFIGNLLFGNYNTPDMVASSIEIARRGYKKYVKSWFYPKFDVKPKDEQWKQTLQGVESWVELYKKVKKLDLKYRFLLMDNIQNAVFSKFYKKSNIQILNFDSKL